MKRIKSFISYFLFTFALTDITADAMPSSPIVTIITEVGNTDPEPAVPTDDGRIGGGENGDESY